MSAASIASMTPGSVIGVATAGPLRSSVPTGSLVTGLTSVALSGALGNRP